MPEETTTTTYVALLHLRNLHLRDIESEEQVWQAKVRNPQEEAKHALDSVYAFFYFDIVRAVVEVGGERIEVASERRNISKTYYIDARVLDYDTVKALHGDHRITLRYMEGSVLRCRTGNFVPYEPDNCEIVIVNGR